MKNAGLAALLVLLALLVCCWRWHRRPCSACLPRAPRANVEPLTLLCCDERQFRQAAAAARWPEELRRNASLDGDRLCVVLGFGAELFPDWDAAVRGHHRRRHDDSALPLASHPLRACLRALASPRTCRPLPLATARDERFACPDPRILVGSEALLVAALPLAAGGSCLAAFRLGLWSREAQLDLRVPERELAYLPAADGEGEPLHPTASELRAAVQELGKAGDGDVVLPSI
jgi:hypothetical protein